METLPPLDAGPLPAIDLRHLLVLTDDTAIFQHANRSTPNLHHGYCTDDTARALIAVTKFLALPADDRPNRQEGGADENDLLVVLQRYLAFLSYAYNEQACRFRNFMQFDRSWLETVGSQDSHARAIWALGKTVRLAPNEDIRELADHIMLRAIGALDGFDSLRPWAYGLLGLQEYLHVYGDRQPAVQLRQVLAERLFKIRQQQAEDDWPWWEEELSWGNAKLPHALIVAGAALGRDDMLDAGLESLQWVLDLQTADDGHLSIIGNHGWYRRGGRKARFDQQPIEAKAFAQACLAAATITRQECWTERAQVCFEWFTGRNDIGQSLHNPQTGGCHDGLGEGGVNSNQGAESTLAYLLTVLAMHHYAQAAGGNEHLMPAPGCART